MPLSVRTCLASVAVLFAAGVLFAQRPQIGEDESPVHVPARPATRAELDRLEALKLYAVAVVQERGGRLIEAVRTYEEARRLDPDSASIHRGLAGLYFSLDRADDAVAACRRVLDLDPDDVATAYVYSRHLRLQNKSAEALPVLVRMAALPALKERPDLLLQVHFDLGVLYEDGNDLPRSQAAYRQVAALLDDPPEALIEQGPFTAEELRSQAAEVYERLGRVELKADQTDKAVADFQQARKKDPARAPRLSLHLAEVYAKQGKSRQALTNLDDFLRSQPQGMDGYEMKITLLKKLDRADDVVPELEAASARDHHNLSLKLLLARECRKAGKTKRAEDIYTSLSRENPTVDVYRGIFALCKDDGADGAARALDLFDGTVARAEKDGALTEAAQARAMLGALRDDPELCKRILPVVRQRLRTGKPLTYQTNVLFATLAAQGNQAEAAEELYRGVLNRRDLPPALEADAYVGLLQVLSMQRKHEAVVEVCKRGLEKAEATSRVLFHVDLSHAYASLGDDDKALAAAEDAVNESNEKQRLRCRLNRARILAQCADKERKEKATAECQALLKEYNQPGDVRTIRYTWSGILSTIGDQARSEEQLKLILDGDPNDASACNDLGYLWADQGKNLPEAERLIRKALDLDRRQRSEGPNVQLDADRDNAAYVDSLAWVLFRRGQIAEARRELDRAIKLPGGGDDPVMWDHLGDVCFRQGDETAARAAWKKALEQYQAGLRRNHTRQVEDLKEKIRLLR
jgi:tetratricopeptide (TPR) repeat protein